MYLCHFYCDFLQGIGLTPTLWEFSAAVKPRVKLMLIFFLCSLLCVIAIVYLGKEVEPELCELPPQEQRSGKSCSLVFSLQAVNLCFHKIMCKSRCVVIPVYKQNIYKSVWKIFLF